MSSITVFVTSMSGGGQPIGLKFDSGAFIYEVIDATIAKLKLEVTPDKFRLRISSSGAGGVGLDPRTSLCAADVADKTELVFEVIHSPVGAFV